MCGRVSSVRRCALHDAGARWHVCGCGIVSILGCCLCLSLSIPVGFTLEVRVLFCLIVGKVLGM